MLLSGPALFTKGGFFLGEEGSGLFDGATLLRVFDFIENERSGGSFVTECKPRVEELSGKEIENDVGVLDEDLQVVGAVV